MATIDGMVLAMPARDHYHQQVRQALIADGWHITHDPLRLSWGTRDMYVDLAAEELLAAEKDRRKIAVEIKGFSGASVVNALEGALGQYILYQDVLANVEPTRELFLAVTQETFEDVFTDPLGALLLQNGRLRLLIFDPGKEIIERWIPTPPTVRSSSES